MICYYFKYNFIKQFIMEEKDFLFVEQIMEQKGILPEEMLAYLRKKYPFKIVYEGMFGSWKPISDKKPLGVICEDYLVTLHDSPVPMTWRRAMAYCENFTVEGIPTTAGDKKFWGKIIRNREEDELSNLLISLGGDGLRFDRSLWCANEFDNGQAFYYNRCLFCDLGLASKRKCFYVRPVLNLKTTAFVSGSFKI